MIMMTGMVGAISPTLNYFGGVQNYSNLVLKLRNSETNLVSPSPAMSFTWAAVGTTPVRIASETVTANTNYMTYDGANQVIRYADNPNLQPGRGSNSAGANAGTGGYGTNAAYSIQFDFRTRSTSGTLISLGNGSAAGWPSYTVYLTASNIAWIVSTTNTGNTYSGTVTSGVLNNVWYRLGIMFYNATTDTNSQINKVSFYFGQSTLGTLPRVANGIDIGYPYNHQGTQTGADESTVGIGIGGSIIRNSFFTGDMKNIFMGRSRFW